MLLILDCIEIIMFYFAGFIECGFYYQHLINPHYGGFIGIFLEELSLISLLLSFILPESTSLIIPHNNSKLNISKKGIYHYN